MPQPGYVIDSAAFAREGRSIEGDIEVAALARLADFLAQKSGVLRFSAVGERQDGHLFLDVMVEGTLALRCQRCLEPLAHVVTLASRFRLVEPGEVWPDEELSDDSFDAIAAEHEQDLVDLIEQEVLLSLPAAPRHADCEPLLVREEARPASPFARLAVLKRGSTSSDS
jgi:uncharacterized protein